LLKPRQYLPEPRQYLPARDGGGAYGTLARGHFNRCASPVLPRTQLVERLEDQTDLLSVFGFRVHFLKPIHQRGIFGT
jgi:hypothetical protein